MLTEEERAYSIHYMSSFSNLDGKIPELDEKNVCFLAYLQNFPRDHSVQEWYKGGKIALHQVIQPSPYGEYTQSRGPLYQAEQACLFRSCLQWKTSWIFRGD